MRAAAPAAMAEGRDGNVCMTPLVQVDACIRGLKEYAPVISACPHIPSSLAPQRCTSRVCFRFGVTPGNNVALLMVPGAEFTLLQLASIKLGACCLALLQNLHKIGFNHHHDPPPPPVSQVPPLSASTPAPALQ
jgi:hypothetical protein